MKGNKKRKLMKCKTKNREKSMNQEDNSSKVKTFAQQMTLGRR